MPQLRALEEEEHITNHHCIQGWSGIAQWNGVSMKKIIQLVQPKPSARTVAFFSFENQLGYKMVEWIERIEFIQSEKELG